MLASTAILRPIHSPHALQLVSGRLERYPRVSVRPGEYLVSVPGIGRMLATHCERELSLDLVARDDNALAAVRAAVTTELAAAFPGGDFCRSVDLSWHRRDRIPVALR